VGDFRVRHALSVLLVLSFLACLPRSAAAEDLGSRYFDLFGATYRIQIDARGPRKYVVMVGKAIECVTIPDKANGELTLFSYCTNGWRFSSGMWGKGVVVAMDGEQSFVAPDSGLAWWYQTIERHYLSQK
jgi:hypothetical protein